MVRKEVWFIPKFQTKSSAEEEKQDGDWGGIKDEGQGREMFSQLAEDSSQA